LNDNTEDTDEAEEFMFYNEISNLKKPNSKSIRKEKTRKYLSTTIRNKCEKSQHCRIFKNSNSI